MSNLDSPIQNKPARGKYQILIAEDDNSISNLLKMQLEIAGYKVLTSSDGKKALEDIANLKPSFVLMDISMPELDGFEVIDALKNQGFDTGSFQLTFLSNSTTPGDIEKASGYGADYRIKAELSPKGLIELIDNSLKIV